ncbi:hypothetical protein [Mycolicibacterium canariasense]|uniref:hypothetical protein n=1 Tax=Mycolicibacterium canariasense TaxID=228230 RepID=UPI000A15D0F2|nr:hypothetical protein [Mycolicibacterium canariasense]MCV7208389.1 hypothetical protein [Mycolicibacterium canariasense]ORV13571.1 hypothetical protein AWB94_04955 [Mycolicibacterium canariasense]
MTIQQILRFKLTCDGWYPDGHGPCPCDLTVEATSQQDAEAQAISTGWSRDHRGWICNADGHLGDQVKG